MKKKNLLLFSLKPQGKKREGRAKVEFGKGGKTPVSNRPLKTVKYGNQEEPKYIYIYNII